MFRQHKYRNTSNWIMAFMTLFTFPGFNATFADDSTRVVQGSDQTFPIISGADTLHLKKTYTLDYPSYEPSQDSSKRSDARVRIPESPKTGLDAQGSISRGIQVSSNASVSLQSSMYLKIDGKLTDGYTVSGVLTDKTSPLQPIGNTRRLNDFDRVMISVNGPSLNASIGDIDLRLKNGKFGKMERSIEGVTLLAKRNNMSVQTALGFSYGEYQLLQIQGKDGKQGPYRLIGKNGEKFIIVLAGSEKIRLDDQALQRGEAGDYIIDYNAAEIHFTQKNILSSNSRISIEFEYVPDIYLASYSFGKQLMSAGISLGDQQSSNFYLSAHWQELRDDQNNPLGNIETDQLHDIFDHLSPDISNTLISGAVLDSINGSYDLNDSNILVYRGYQQGTYAVTFSYVGLEQGQYRKELSASDPYYVYDTESGEYLPAQRFIAPQALSVLSLTTRAKNRFGDIAAEVGVSRDTKNLYATRASAPEKFAWDINVGSTHKYFELRWGDKYYENGFLSHDALESIEYYRKWQLTQRLAEEEHLSYGDLRIGDPEQSFVKTSISQMHRSGQLKGQQIGIISKTADRHPLTTEVNSVITKLDTNLSQYHTFQSTLSIGKFITGVHLQVEDASGIQTYIANDHLSSGLDVSYNLSRNHRFRGQYARRQDYRMSGTSNSFLTTGKLDDWRDRREDWSGEYIFGRLLNSTGSVQMKYREHKSDTNATSRYYLGNLKMHGKAYDNRLSFREEFVLDEEHIPKYDYHYIEVDTGYGDYSFDPAINDYIPLSGGRFIRQRMFSDLEEQVRKYENKSTLEYVNATYSKRNAYGYKGRISYETRLKQEVVSDATIQNQALFNLKLDLKTGRELQFRKIGYNLRSTENNSTLYNYGSEENQFVTHELLTDYRWNRNNESTLGLVHEQRTRTLEYNPQAAEEWISYRPAFTHSTKISPVQKVYAELKLSLINDLHLSNDYTESLLELRHTYMIRKQGRLDQRVSYSEIQAEISGIPYSVFSGRQPGSNWKYTVNGRYTFSSFFQVSMNYSIQKRGDNRSEQYLRVEGRTHF